MLSAFHDFQNFVFLLEFIFINLFVVSQRHLFVVHICMFAFWSLSSEFRKVEPLAAACILFVVVPARQLTREFNFIDGHLFDTLAVVKHTFRVLSLLSFLILLAF